MKKSLLTLVSFIGGYVTGGVIIGRRLNGALCSRHEASEKFRVMFDMMTRWMSIRQRKDSVANFLLEKGFRRVAIYGMSSVGELLYEELKDSEVFVEYAIDRLPNKSCEIEVYSPKYNDFKKVDAIIVTAIAYYDEIESNIKKKVTCPIISLEEIVYEMS